MSALGSDPAHADTMYAGGASGGVWKTTDAGVNWSPIFDGQDSLAIGAIAVSPGDSNVVVVGTGEPNFSGDSFYGEGIFRSIDAGAHWSKVTTSAGVDGCYVSDVLFKPGDATVLYASVLSAGTSDYPGGSPGCTGGGIYRSADSGASFTRVATGSWDDLAVHPGDGATWYGGRYGSGVYKWTDGVTITPAQFTSVLPTSGVQRVAVATAPADATRMRLYAAFVDGTGFNFDGTGSGVFTSSDGGTTWTQVTDTTWYGNGDAAFPWYALALLVDRTTATTLYVGTGPALVKLTGAGSGHTEPQAASMHPDFHALAYDASGRLWIGNDGGVYRTTDFTTAPTNLNADLTLTQFGFGGTISTGGVALDGTQDNGSLLSDGSSLPWKEIGPPCDGGWSAIHPTTASDAVMTVQGDTGCFGHVVFKTTNAGSTFNTADSGVNNSEAGLFYPPLVEAPTDPNLLFFGRTHLWFSTNRAGAWTSYSTHTFGSRISAVGASALSAKVYVGTENGTIEATTDGGTNWTSGSGLPGRYVTGISVDPNDATTAYATVGGFGADHVFKSTDSGATWNAVLTAATFDSPANAIAVDWRTSPRTLYVATDNGIVTSADDGATWKDATGDMPHGVVYAVAIDQTLDTLVAFTHGRGSFSAALPNTGFPQTSIDSGPAAFTNDPTPTFTFSSSTPGATFECRMDSTNDADFQACGSPFTPSSALVDGPHVFDVRAVSSTTDPSPATRSFTVDTVPPDTTITHGPRRQTAKRKATFTFTSTQANSTFMCKIDKRAFASCVSGKSFTLRPGRHTFQVEAIDPASNIDPVPAKKTWTITP